MLKKISLVPLLLFAFIACATAQITGSVTGKIVGSNDKKPVEFAAVILKNTADTSRVFGAVSNTEGVFKFISIPFGSYTLKISFVGKAILTRTIALQNARPDLDLGALEFDDSAISLDEVRIAARQAAVKLKKDTIEFNAGSFKTRPDATTEELLKKLPGVAVDKDGNITVGGQKVSRLTVDGKDFFGTDPKTATRNLPADAIDKIQLVDSKTQEAKATGIDDGQREKVLNLTIKKDKKQGWFGNINGSAGNSDRYNGYLSANSFGNTRQVAILGMSNNVNAANFSFDDLLAFSGGNLGDVFAPPGGGNFTINTDGKGNTNIQGSGLFENAAQGLVDTHAGGINFSDEFGKKKPLKVNLSYFTYFSTGNQRRIANAQDLGTGELLNTYENNLADSYSQAHRLNAKAEYHPDSLTDLNFRSNMIYSISRNNSTRSFNSNYETLGKVNDGSQTLNRTNTQPSLFGELTLLRRLGYKKGSFSLRMNGNWTKSDGGWNNVSLINTFPGGVPSLQAINEDASQDIAMKGYTLNGNYARPFSQRWSGNITYSYIRSNSLADQVTNEYNPLTGKYETIVPALTNTFDYTNWNQAARLGFIYTPNKVINYNIGASVQQSGLNGKTVFNNGAGQGLLKKAYWSLLPRLAINYNPANNRSVQLNYAESVTVPTAVNLQPVQNNTNPLYKRDGNPDLKPRLSHRLTVNYNTFKPGTDYYWNGYFLANYAIHAVSYNTTIADGIQYQRPLNVDGNYQVNTGTNFGMPSGLKGLRLNFGGSLTIEHYKNFINSAFNTSHRFGIGPNGSVNYDIEDKLNLSLSYYVGYSRLTNKLQEAADSRYFNLNNNFSLSYEFVKNLRLETDLTHNGFAGRSDGFNTNYFLLNAGLIKYFMNRRANLAIKGFDILKQNTNITRSVFNTRVEDTQFNNLTRYFYLSLSYRLAKAGAGNERRNPRSTVN